MEVDLFKALLIFTALMFIGIITTGIIAPVEKGAMFGIATSHQVAMAVFLTLFFLGFGLIITIVVCAIKISKPLPEDPKT